MSDSLKVPEGGDLASRRALSPTLPVRRVGSAIGLTTISLLDLLALDDITTAGAWMPEIAFVIASVPALIVLAYFTFKRISPGDPMP